MPRAAPEIKAGGIRYGVGGGKKDVRCPKFVGTRSMVGGGGICQRWCLLDAALTMYYQLVVLGKRTILSSDIFTSRKFQI